MTLHVIREKGQEIQNHEYKRNAKKHVVGVVQLDKKIH